jgi:hypothetical protein
MTPGIVLLVVGALLTFAVEDHVDNLNLGVAGVILMLAGVAVLVHARTAKDEKTVTVREESSDPEDTTHVVEQITRERHQD